MLKKLLKSSLLALLCALSLAPQAVYAERIKDLSTIAGVRPNQLIGYGLVVGLDGSGDQTTQTPFTLQSVNAMLSAMGISIPPGQTAQLRNTAAVIVTSSLPAFAKPGQQVDITVSSIGNAKSLRGGTLLMTPLRAADGQVYALAQGNVVVSGAGAGGAGARVQINHLSVGRVPGGGLVERGAPQSLDNEFIELEMLQSDFGLMQRTGEAIARRFGPGIALPIDARALQVRVPTDPTKRIAFLAALEELQVTPAADAARVIVNSRTGSVVMNQAVQLGNCAVAHGSLTIRVSRTPSVSQPAPFSRGDTAITSQDSASIQQAGGALIPVAAAATLDQVVRALNLLGANPQDLMAILQAIKAAGALKAEIEVI
jgi:flagellar P-ring protein precursor FlgI